MNNKAILYEDKMKYRDNEFLYNKCVKQYHCIINYQYKMREYKEKLNNIINELEEWAKENNVNDRDIYGYEMEDTKVIYLEDFLDKLKELKGGERNE